MLCADDFLAEHIVKFNTIVRDLQAITPIAAAAPAAAAPRSAVPAY